MTPHPNPEVDAAIWWAVGLVAELQTLDMAGLQTAWTSDEATRHRATLKAHLEPMLRQLVEAVTARRDILKGAA